MAAIVDGQRSSPYDVLMSNRPELVKQFYEAFSKGNRDFAEKLLAPNFTFSAPPDPFLDRDRFFKICWPQGGNLKDIEYVRVIEHGDEVILTHEYAKPDGATGRNTDIVTFAGDKIIRLEVYFGWDKNGH
jgi:ketosteroid isomerase-like protein